MVYERSSNESLNTMVSFFPRSTPLDFAEIRCKNYYNNFKECTIEPTGIKNWKTKFPDSFEHWKNNFSFIYQSTKDNRLRQS